jgi:lipoprotein-anchoring transpeptidase ErfK/SrfK
MAMNTHCGYLLGIGMVLALGATMAWGQQPGRHSTGPKAAPAALPVAAPAALPVAPPGAAPEVPEAPTPPPAAADAAKRPAATVNVAKQTRVNIAWQIALEAANFSPGIIDGHFGRRSVMALNEYKDRFFPGASPFDPRVFNALNVDPDSAITTYSITEDDAAQVGGPIPEDWNAKEKLEKLRYESLADCLTEKFHVSRVLMSVLNPGVRLDGLAPGQTLNVPNLRPFPESNKPTVIPNNSASAYVTVNLGEKTIRVFDKDDHELALFHCSIARDKAKLPARDTVVKNIAAPNPNYTFDPKNWPEVHNVSRVLTIPPGPRNPVGLAWVSLELPGYGIHGTPKPELIGKTGSHGCFRLTNWDALKFAGMVREGMPVKMVNPEK